MFRNAQQCLILYYCETTRLAWFAGLLFAAQTSHLLISQHRTLYFTALSRRVQAVDLQDRHICKNLNPKTSHKPISHRLLDSLSVCVCVCSKFALLITCFRAVYVGHVALWHSPAIKERGSPPLHRWMWPFVKGIIGHFMPCHDEQKQKSGIKREREQQTSELVRNTIDPCVCVFVLVCYKLYPSSDTLWQVSDGCLH